MWSGSYWKLQPLTANLKPLIPGLKESTEMLSESEKRRVLVLPRPWVRRAPVPALLSSLRSRSENRGVTGPGGPWVHMVTPHAALEMPGVGEWPSVAPCIRWSFRNRKCSCQGAWGTSCILQVPLEQKAHGLASNEITELRTARTPVPHMQEEIIPGLSRPDSKSC